MKIVLTTTFIVAILGIGLLGINNTFAQGDGMMGNDTGTMNATLAFAQGDGGIMAGENDTSVVNSTLPMSIIDNNGTSN